MRSITAKISTFLGAGAIIALTALFGLTSNAGADCIYQYNPNGFQTSATPVFNSICNVPYIGDEANFVRIRQNVNGNDEDNTNNPAYSIGTINSSCAAGDKFDVWNYVHNDATQGDNPDVGSGSAVALGTYINMTAPVNTTSDSFSFTATVGDTGNLTGTAGPTSTTNMTPAVLDCDGQQVQLTLVPGTVNQYSEYGQATGPWTNLSQNAGALNTNLAIGSTNAGQSSYNSGEQWGCWNYRIVVVYQVVVTPVSPSQTPPTCNSITANDQAEVKDVSYTANSANVTGYNLDLYSNGTKIASSGNLPVSPSPFPYQFNATLTQGQKYTITATVLSNLGNVTSNGCTYSFIFPTTPTTPTTPPTTITTTSTTLPTTGPGTIGTVGIFAGATALGTGIYYWLLRRRLANK